MFILYDDSDDDELLDENAAKKKRKKAKKKLRKEKKKLKKAKKKARKARYQAAFGLSGDEDDGDADGNNGVDEYEGLEISFKVGFDSKDAADSLERKLADKANARRSKEENKGLSVFEQYQKDKKERRKERKRERKRKEMGGDNDGDGDGGDDEGPDDFFMAEGQSVGFGDATGNDAQPTKNQGKKDKRGKRRREDRESSEAQVERRNRAELDLLMIPEKYGDARDVRHGSQNEDRNFKNVVKDEERKQKKKTKRGGKKKRKAKEVVAAAAVAAGGDFTVDTKDNRFAAMYDDSSFAIDPTDPRFKSTNNMQKILQEKQARRKASSGGAGGGVGVVTYSAGTRAKVLPTVPAAPTTESLVETLKRKHQAWASKSSSRGGGGGRGGGRNQSSNKKRRENSGGKRGGRQ